MHTRFGVLVIGDEMLCGKRLDKHLAHVIETLGARGMAVGWYRLAGDERRSLCETLRQTQENNEPVLCFGGIGATPDDNTRQAAAQAFGRPLEVHAGALALIEAQFGDAAHPNRIRMAELPQDALLIPNPVNRIPGFTLYEHHFFPGFPNMAWPMLEWVLERYYPVTGSRATHERSLRVFGAPESELLGLMEALTREFPAARLFSLPHFGEPDNVEIGFRGEQVAVDAAFAGLVAALTQRRLLFEFEVAA
ncbi:MAG: competence/damage-inducible protein A [Thiogranum sp.]|nr:competence/damage-inducible protein A [Thiogranum sp.]